MPRLLEPPQNLTEGQKKVLRYILDNSEECAFLSASELARRTGVSEATVIRLAQALGFEGFPELKEELRTMLKERISTVMRLEAASDRARDEGDVLLKVFRKDIENLSQTVSELPVDTFREAVKAVRKADRLYVIGLRSAYSLALFLWTAMRYIGKEAFLLRPGHGELWDEPVLWRRRDVLIAISFPRYTRDTVEVVQYARRKGLRCIAITDSLLSPVAQVSDIVLTARCEMDSYVESFTAPLSLINALVTAVSVAERDKALKALRRLEGIWRERNIYLQREEKSGKAFGTDL